MSVAIVVPVLDRPQNAVPLMASAAAATPGPYRLLFVAQADDVAELAALEEAGADFIVVAKDRRSWACKINDGYRATSEPWLFTGADDLGFREGWFERALAWADETTGVIGTNDLWNPRVMTGQHSTHSLVRRAYVDEHGTVDGPGVLHEGYPHQFADDELVQTAMARGAYVHAFDSIVQHLRPRSPAEEDATYRLGRQAHQQGKRLFQQRRRLWANLTPGQATPARAVVVTACYGGVDSTLRAPAGQDMPVDWICFTDVDGLAAPPPWRVVHEPARFADPVMAAKVHKCTPTVDATDVVWIDASHEITSRSFVREALAARRGGVAAFRHPRRECIYDEAVASLGAEGQGGKYVSQPLMEQVAAYRAEGHPEHGGLYACGVVAWDLADERAVALGQAWLAECERWSWQDQLSFPVVARRLGITPGVFPVRQIERARRGCLENRWFKIHAHTVAVPPAAPVVAAPAEVSVLIPFTSGCSHREAARRFVLDWYAQHHPAWEIVEAGCDGEWSKGAALAAAAAQATHDVLVVADADSFLVPDVLGESAGLVVAGAPWVMPHRKVHRLTQAHTAEVLDGAAPVLGRCHRSPYSGVVGGGITVLSREAWATVGGVDPRFLKWGGEDLSFGLALTTLAGPVTRLDAALVHLWHPPEQRGEGRSGGRENSALHARYRQASGKPDAMRALIDEHAAVPA